MATTTAQPKPPSRDAAQSHSPAIGWRIALMPVVMSVILFAPAGRIDLPFHWAYLFTMLAYTLVACRTIDPDLIQERLRPGPGGVDRNLRPLASIVFAAHLVVAGLSIRFGWGDRVAAPLQWTGFGVLVVGMAWIAWSIHVNRFFSPVVRIQAERGHHVIASGPYRFVRHPGYLGTLTACPGGGLMLGSWWALLAMLPVAFLILRRAVREDRYLREHLAGYGDYAHRVRWGLAPWVW